MEELITKRPLRKITDKEQFFILSMIKKIK